jgi:YidC/Oxa1 family membrane protein insertase
VIVAGILSPIENALAWLLRHLHDSVGFSWGWSIIALTVIVRVALVPLMVRQIHSMQSMQRHMPEMKEIQQRYKGDRQRLNEELMKFYKANNINPAASCLPLLFQFPIFIALYFVLRNFTKHVTATPNELGWLIVPDITAKITAHWSGAVLLVVYVASQVSSGYFASTSAQRSQRILLMVLPVFFVPVILRFPVGLLMYWVTTNLWTVGQGIITRQMTPKPVPPPKRSSRTASKDEGQPQAQPQTAKAAAAATPARPAPPRRVKRKKKRTRR